MNHLRFIYKNMNFIGIFTLFISVFSISIPIYILHVFNNFNTGSVETLVWQTILTVSAIIALVLLEVGRKNILIGTSQQLDHALAIDLTKSMLDKLPGNREQEATLKDLNAVKQLLSGRAMAALFDAPWFLLFLGVIYFMDPMLGIVATIGVAIVIVSALSGITMSRRLANKAEAQGKRADDTINHALGNHDLTYSMGMSDAVIINWEEHAAISQSFQSQNEKISGSFFAFGLGMRLILQVAMIFTAALLVIIGSSSQGILIAATILLGKMLAPVELFIANIPTYINAWESYKRLKNFKPGGADQARFRDHSMPGKVDVRDLLVKSQGSRRLVLRGINLSVQPGETLALVGPSGAGKSTLAKSIIGTQPPTGGQVLIDGSQLDTWSSKERQRSIGYLPQNSSLFPGTIAENIARLSDPKEQLVIDAARITGIDAMIRNLPSGYDTKIGVNGQPLSAGEQQRIALARAIYGSPRIVVLDEPNASIDAEGERALFACMEVLKQRGATIIVITHRPGILTGVNRVAVMDKGVVKDIGHPAAVLRALSRVHADTVQTQQRAVQELSHA